MKIFKYLLLVALFLGPVNAAFGNDHSAKRGPEMLATTSSWVNQSGSVASISFTNSSQPGTFLVAGTYINNASGYRCQGTPYPLSGIYYANTQTISFSVSWSNSSEDCQSVTGWTGYINIAASPLIMKTNWNIAYQTGNGHAVSQGSDTFTVQSTVLSKQLLSQ